GQSPCRPTLGAGAVAGTLRIYRPFQVGDLVDVPVGISNSADVDKDRAILVQLSEAHPDVRELASCLVTAPGDSSMQLCHCDRSAT
ncbi:MAG: hypothetical protein KDB23_20825, partial [Planctomycetales bacterium]|nr:hypothetical protein [Planctomycetales bacterium]